MFSSNQVLEISGDLRHDGDLRDALEFALKKSGWHECFTRKEEPTIPSFQITKYGDFCIGWGDKKEGWTKFQFDYDLDMITGFIEQTLKKQQCNEFGGDGTNSHGFLMKAVEYNAAGVKNPFYGIVIFSSYNCYYAK